MAAPGGAFWGGSMNRKGTGRLATIIQQHISELQEHARACETWRDLKFALAELPDHADPDRTRRIAMEHDREGVAAMTAVLVLEQLQQSLVTQPTLSEVIAGIKEWTALFSERARDCAHRGNNLPDGHPQKSEDDEHGFIFTTVVAALVALLNKIGVPTENPAQVDLANAMVKAASVSAAAGASPRVPSTPHPAPKGISDRPLVTMAGRLGQVIYWCGCAVALVVGLFFVGVGMGAPGMHASDGLVAVIAGIVLGAIIWAVGYGLRYILAGPMAPKLHAQ